MKVDIGSTYLITLIINTMNKITKIVSGSGVAIALALTMLIGASQAKAFSPPNILVGENMTLGSTGQDVAMLQGLLSEFGYLNVPAGIPLGYYGAMTKDAVARYQASLFVFPTAGYFGPATKIAMHKDFAPRGWLTLLGW